MSMDYYPNDDPIVEPTHARALRGTVGSAQISLDPRTLQVMYTYISLEFGSPRGMFPDARRIHADALAPPRHSRVPCGHRRPLANRSHRQDEGGDEALLPIQQGRHHIDEYHWMARPRACHYYRQVKALTDTGVRMVPIARYDWEEAQRLANSEPRRLEATSIWKHPDGTAMSNEQTLHSQLMDAHTKRLDSLKTERTLLHTIFSENGDDTLIAFTTDEHGHVTPPGDGYMLLIYMSDRKRTMSAAQLHPKTDNYILPKERLHITAQTITGLHGDASNLDTKRVPVQIMDDDDLRRVNSYRAEYRIPNDPKDETDKVLCYQLGPPGGQFNKWPDSMFHKTTPTACKVFTVQNTLHEQRTIIADGTSHVYTTTGQQEFPFDLLSPAPRDDIIPTSIPRPAPDYHWDPPKEISLGGNLMRVELSKTNQY